jgi:SAM-dependent methyltransferase
VFVDKSIDRSFGRRAFGFDPAAYHRARPGYPNWVYASLCERCGLAPGAAVFEIGAGTGTATRRLLDLGAAPLIAVEPDARLAAFLRESNPDAALSVMPSPFEEAVLDEAGFDLGVSATAFHWLDEEAALTKIARLLRPGGWWVAVWNVFGDNSRPDPFHDATAELVRGRSSPSAGTCGRPFALDTQARLAAIDRVGAFDKSEHQSSVWSLVLDPDEAAALCATYSNINIRPDREAVLAEVRRIARDQFHGRVIRNMTTILYTARRSS